MSILRVEVLIFQNRCLHCILRDQCNAGLPDGPQMLARPEHHVYATSAPMKAAWRAYTPPRRRLRARRSI